MGKFKGINHLALVTGDMDKTTKFYRDILGMDLVATIGGELAGEPMRHYFFKCGDGTTIAFFEWDGVKAEHKPAGLPARGAVQFDHLSLNVEDEEALLALKAHLGSHGVDVTRVVDHDFIRSIYFTDPNGIALEASYWVRDATASENPTQDTSLFKDPNPVPSVQAVASVDR